MENIYVFLADGFETVEALAVVDLLRRAGHRVQTVSIMEKTLVTSAQQIGVEADLLFEEAVLEEDALLVLPGGMPGTKYLAAHSGLTGLLKTWDKNNRRIGAICAAPSVLGSLGILEQKHAVCYPGFEEMLTGAIVEKKEVVTDGNVTTSRGMGTAIPFGLELIRLLDGEKTAQKIKESIIYGD